MLPLSGAGLGGVAGVVTKVPFPNESPFLGFVSFGSLDTLCLNMIAELCCFVFCVLLIWLVSLVMRDFFLDMFAGSEPSFVFFHIVSDVPSHLKRGSCVRPLYEHRSFFQE